jgi:hypothetical protein
MASWEYRVVEYSENGICCYGMFEILNDNDGNPVGYSRVGLEGWDERKDLDATVNMLIAAVNKPALLLEGKTLVSRKTGGAL